VSWIDSTTLEVKQRCLVPVSFNNYKDKIWCDVITINVGQVILGRPWLFDKIVTIYGRSNMCQFEHEGKQIKLVPLRPKTGQPQQTSTLALLQTPPSPPLIATVPSLSPTNHAYHVCKSLPLLLLIPSHCKTFESAPAFASHKHVHKLHKEISDENKWSNVKPTLQADSRKIFKIFNVGDYVMVQIYPKQFLLGSVKMLHVRSAGPFKILNKLNCNTYVIDLPLVVLSMLMI